MQLIHSEQENFPEMADIYEVQKVSSTIQKREREGYGEAIDGEEIVTVAYFQHSLSIQGWCA